MIIDVQGQIWLPNKKNIFDCHLKALVLCMDTDV